MPCDANTDPRLCEKLPQTPPQTLQSSYILHVSYSLSSVKTSFPPSLTWSWRPEPLSGAINRRSSTHLFWAHHRLLGLLRVFLLPARHHHSDFPGSLISRHTLDWRLTNSFLKKLSTLKGKTYRYIHDMDTDPQKKSQLTTSHALQECPLTRSTHACWPSNHLYST